MIPVTTIGGYLGAGKTTLVNHLLRHAGGLRLAVLVNEFGALPIDGDLVEASGDDIVSIAGGCVCCAFGDSLVAALTKLSRLTPRPDHFLIEASGVAIPGSVAATVALVHGLRRDATVVLADSETIRSHAADSYIGDTVIRQLTDADLVLLTKTDLVTEHPLKKCADWLAKIAPNAQVIPVTRGRIPPSVILDAPENLAEPVRSPHFDQLFESIVLRTDPVNNPRDLANLVARGGFGVIRSKGHVMDVTGRRFLIQTVGARFETKQGPGSEPNGFVCIGLRGRWKPDELRMAVSAEPLS